MAAGTGLCLLLLVNWCLSPSFRPDKTVDDHLTGVLCRWYAEQPGPQAGEPIYVGVLCDGQVIDCSQSGMALCREAGLLVRPFSELEPSGLGELRNRKTKRPGDAIILLGHTWIGRNTVELNAVLRSGFCATGVTLTATHNLWGWGVTDTKPWYGFAEQESKQKSD